MADLFAGTKELYQFLHDNHNGLLSEILCSLEFLQESVGQARIALENSPIGVYKVASKQLEEIGSHINTIQRIENLLSGYLDLFSGEEEFDSPDEDIDNNETEREIPNYAAYRVDSEIPHLLTESFEYKKICGFMLNGTRYTVDNWKMALIKFCELLVEKDADKFQEVISSDTFVGRKISIFSSSNNGNAYYCKLVNAPIYVWTNRSANGICSIIHKLLLGFRISINSMYIYLRADYTDLHKNLEAEPPVELSSIDEGEKIGAYVRRIMRELSKKKYHFSPEMLQLLTSESGTKKLFGFGLPFFKEVRGTQNVSTLMKDDNGYNRYWREIFEFNNRKYLIISQWTKNHSDRFNTWLNELLGK